MGGGLRDVNVVVTRVGQCPNDAKFETIYNDETQYLGNQMGGSHPIYHRQGRNQGWNKERDNSLKYWRVEI
ncbi:hypothetical protein MTR67_018599 [Solanum verrucosum]|uniref:Uncharacterized protein n=1 Tax=Solanum verrucosum TaxID=315347 RepID=A0AAF0QJZ5_SOLVR|nr:hypothetical protein MTR67_018599 [Solanum verrucosum]